MKNESWKKNLLRTALLAITVCTLPALAGPDNVGLGNGSDGTLTVSTVNQVINVYARVTAPLAPGDTAIVVGSAAGIVADDLLLVLQTTGIVPEPPSGGPTPIDLTNNPVGRWEFARVSIVAGSTLHLTAPLLHSYAGNVTQVIRVPEYTNVTINAGRSISPAAWNGSTGGVVAFLVSGTFTNNGSVDARSRGFRGGQPVNDPSGTTGCTGLNEAAPMGAQKGEGIAVTRYGAAVTGRGRAANGAGGGICLKSGGGGGGNGGAGGQGGNTDLSLDSNRAVGGEGGAALTFSLLDHLMMGGGGGAGHSTEVAAGVGGGIIFVRVNALSGTGDFTADGSSGGVATDAASGGGAGGTIYLRIAGSATCSSIQATGGMGGSTGTLAIGPGGGGGGGRVLFQKGSGTCTLTGTAVIGANPGTQFDPGVPGGRPYGAIAGSNGSSTPLTGGFPLLPAPVVDTPADGSQTNDATPTYSGTISITPALPAGTEVAIFVDGVEKGQVTPDALGNWTFTPITPLAPGSHFVNAIAINTSQAVQSTVSNTNTFTLDVMPPTVEVTTPAEGLSTTDSTPTYNGTVEAGATVVIRVDGTVVGNAVVTGTTWTFTQPTALTEGPHMVMAEATDAAGNTATDSNNFTVDLTPPTVEMTTPPEGSSTNDSTPTYSGTVEAGATVVIRVDGTVVGNAVVTGTTWTFTQPTALSEGPHTVAAEATDAAGNTATDSNNLTVDLTAPAVEVTTPAEGSSTNNSTPTYNGTIEVGSTVVITVDGVVLGNATVTGNTWTFTPAMPLADGPHTVAAEATDGAGNSASDSNTFTVDLTAPAMEVTTPAEGLSTNDSTPTYSGTVEAGATVVIRVDGVVLGNAVVTGTTWTFTQPTALTEGPHTMTAEATDAVGNSASDSNTFTVDLMAPAVEVTTPAESSSTNDSTPTYSGTVEVGSTVVITVDGVVLGNTTVTGSTWTFTPTVPLADGPHTITATAMDEAGNTASISNIFTVDTLAPFASVVMAPVDGSITNNNRPTYSGMAEANSTITVIVDGAVAGTTTADGTGDWSLVQLTALVDGSHTVKATAQDTAGNTSTDSNTNTFTVDTLPPAAPVVTAPADGSVFNDDTPTYMGTALADSTVAVIVDGTPMGTTTANGAGDWSFTPVAPLPDGPHAVKATAQDTAGNTSVDSNINIFTVATIPPAAPVVLTPANDSTTSDNTPTYRGTAVADSIVTVIVDGVSVGSTTAGAAGHWSLVPPTPLADGQHTVKAFATNTGGTSPDSNINTFTVVRDPSTGGWSTTGDLVTARTGHTATVLPSEKVLVTGGEGPSGPLANAELYDPSTGGWSTTGDLATARTGHTATVLPSGKVLVIGGEGPSGPLASVELYDPATGTWSTTGDLSTTRQGHTATVLPSGKVLVTGGEGSSGPLASAELYDPATGTWSTTNSLATARTGHTATLLRSGQVFVTGGEGSNGPLASTELYDPATGTWSPTNSLATARKNHSATALLSGQVLITGGEDSSGFLASTELYDPATESWSTTGALATARRNPSAVLLPSGRVLVAGSESPGGALSSTEVYAPSTGVWSPTGLLATARKGHTATVLPTGHVLITGGLGADGLLASVEMYEAVGASRPTAPLPEARTDFMTVLLPNGLVLVAGGSDSSGPLATAWLYDPATKLWTQAANMLTPRSSATTTLLPTGQVLVTGGRAVARSGLQAQSTDTGSVLSSAELYDPVANTWRYTNSLNDARYSHSATLLSTGQVLVTGGLNASDTLNTTAEVYDVASGTWLQTSPMHTPRRQHMVAQLSTGQVLVAGGLNAEDTALSTAEVYDPVQRAWALTAEMSTARAASTAIPLPTSQVMVVGGTTDGHDALSTAEVYNPVRREWVLSEPLNTARKSHTALLLPTGRVLIMGGSDGSSILDGVEVYDTAQNKWEVLTPLTEPREDSMTVQLSTGQMLVLGGKDLLGPLKNTELYDEFGPPDTLRPMVDELPPQTPGARPIVQGSRFMAPPGGSSRVRIQLAPRGALRDLPAEELTDTSVRVALAGVPDGFHLLFVMVNDIAGGRVVQVDGAAPGAPSVKAFTGTPQPTLSGTAEPHTTIQVSLSGQVEGTTQADFKGDWHLPLSTALENRTYTASAIAMDAVGNRSSSSSPFTFTVDTQAPEEPVVEPLDAFVKNPRPTLGGTAEPGSTVTVWLDGKVLGMAQTDTMGLWSLPLPQALEDGIHTASATATDQAGNTSLSSTAITFTVDTQAPTAPEVLTPEEGATVASGTVTISGTAEPGSLVTVSVNGEEKDPARADSQRTWSLTLTGLENGEHTLSATAKDAAGNDSPPSAGRSFTMGNGDIVVPYGGCSGCAGSPGEPSLVLLGLAALWRLLSRRRFTQA